MKKRWFVCIRNKFEMVIQKADNDLAKLCDFASKYLENTLKCEDFAFLFNEIRSSDFKRQFLGLLCLDYLLDAERCLIKKVIDGNLVPKLIDFLEQEDFPDLQKKSAWFLTKIVKNGTEKQIHYLINFGFISPLLKLLASNNILVVEYVKCFVYFQLA